ncbi:MAG: FHA domain-containing protein [Actinomycetota bacterium]
MTDQILNILKFVLLGLLYLFFARVLWAVWSEVRTPAQRPVAQQRQAVTAAAARPATSKKSLKTKRSSARVPKGKKGRAGRLVVLEPKQRRGMTVPLQGEITLGRDPNSTIVIDDDGYISQLHLRVFDYEGQPMVEDLGSTNGTFHNGNKLIGTKLLHKGDRLQVGTTVIEAQ